MLDIMRSSQLLITLIIIFSFDSAAGQPNNFPIKLFGVTLGQTYFFDPQAPDDPGDFPVSKIAGFEKFLAPGFTIFFKPNKEYKEFSYAEEDGGKEHPECKKCKATFSMYVLPDIPSSIVTSDQLEKAKIGFIPISINWRNLKDKDAKNDKLYWWAHELCRIFEVDINIKPEVIDVKKENLYICYFRRSEKQLKVSANDVYAQEVSLSYDADTWMALDKAFADRIRKIQANEIRPY
jgi:hypothetical protein